MIKFTKEEISLCKQVAEKHKKLIDYGNWYWDKGLKKAVVISVKLGHLQDDPYFIKNCIPLWTISDCLEFLRERKILDWSIDKEWDEDGKLTGNICFWWKPDLKKFGDNYTLGKTPLEACLKAVLAVLEEGK